MKSRAGPAGLSRQLDALQQTAELGRDRLDPGTVEQAEALIDKARERLAKGAEVVVAALAGGTGSGKSSLFNALAGATLAEVGPRRPTTADARAWAVGDPSGSRALLDWLGVKQRHAQPPGPGAPDGLVLLDLPDHDSVEVDHRFVVDRFVERVDMLIWVVDPLKYAQRALHAGYLRALALHADVMVVVLNRIDQLAPADRRACRSDLKRLLDAEGLSRTPILTTSATTGEGVDELRALIAGEVGRRRAIAERLSADVRTLAAEIRSQVGPAAPGRGAVADLTRAGRQSAPLRSALASAAGVQARADVGAALYRSAAKAATRPLLSRLIWGLVTLALRPFRLLRPTRRPRPAPAEDAVAGPTAPAAPIAVRHALLELADAAAHGLPPRWGPRLRQLLAGVGRDLPRRVIDALESVAVQRPRRRWWRPVGLLWSASEAVALAGLIWLAALAALAWLQLPAPDTPNVAGRLPWPTALLAGGAAAWLVLGWVRNRLVSLGASRWRRRLAAQLQQALADVVAEHVAAPLEAELDAQSALARAVEQAAGNR